MAESVFILLSFLTALVFLLGRWAGYSTRKPGEVTPFCAKCGYSLDGLSQIAICPECACTERRRTRSRRVYAKADAAAFRCRAFPIIAVPFIPALVWYPMLRLEGFSHCASWAATTLQLDQTTSGEDDFSFDIVVFGFLLLICAYAFFRFGPVTGRYFANRSLAFALVLLITELSLLAYDNAASWSQAAGVPFSLAPFAVPLLMLHTSHRWGIPFFPWQTRPFTPSGTTTGPVER